ncbi:glycosyltransferase family 4 protein [Microbacterium sp.]|uniref:glycosyltransferase family 4 protein n=1 Tax=Microbacterium sp. TaxID=51671 RepID=UPI0033414A5C
MKATPPAQHVDVAALLPAQERFDGEGGAIATWVRETYALSRYTTVVACPYSSVSFAGAQQVTSHPVYRAFDVAMRGLSRALAFAARKSFAAAYYRILPEKIWVYSAFRKIKDARLVHVHNRPHYARMLRGFGYRGVIMLHMHNDLTGYVSKSAAGEVFESNDGVAFCSEFMMDRAQGEYPEASGLVVIPNGVSRRQITRQERGDRDGSVKLIYAGRIIPEKGPLEAVAVCAELRRRGVDARIDLVGGTGAGSDNAPSPYLSQVLKAAHKLNADAGTEVARVLGPKPHSEVFQLFAENDFFVYPCEWEEPFGMVALEAMAKGCVPFVPRKGGLPGVVQGGGVVVDAGPGETVAAFADAIEDRLGSSTIDELRQRGWTRAEQLTWESIAEVADGVFERTLSARSWE